MSTNILKWLEDWYTAQCDGDWEHEFGLQIGTLDNPGWSVEIDVSNISSAEAHDSVDIRRFENDWLRYQVKESKFVGFCGPQNLSELLEAFRDIIEAEDSTRGSERS